MHKRGSLRGRILAAAVPSVLWLLATTSAASPVKPTPEIQVAPLAGSPLAQSQNAPALRLRENHSLPKGGWVETGAGDRALVWLLGAPGCHLILEPGSRLHVKVAPGGGLCVANLERGALRSAGPDCRAVIEVGTPVARLRGEGAQFRVETSKTWTTVHHHSGELQLLFQGQAIPLRALTLTTVSSSGSHRIASITQPEKEEGFPALTRGPAREEAIPAERISPVSAPGRP